MPHMPLGAQEAAEFALKDGAELPPAIFEAKVEIILWICLLPHSGQTRSSIALVLNTSSSNG